ncbi:MAG: hypothetical protein VX475_00025 [Myxococcota bacterium]|nr:hypothetical protein [Myxococcota bacterium]
MATTDDVYALFDNDYSNIRRTIERATRNVLHEYDLGGDRIHDVVDYVLAQIYASMLKKPDGEFTNMSADNFRGLVYGYCTYVCRNLTRSPGILSSLGLVDLLEEDNAVVMDQITPSVEQQAITTARLLALNTFRSGLDAKDRSAYDAFIEKERSGRPWSEIHSLYKGHYETQAGLEKAVSRLRKRLRREVEQ